MDHGEIDVRSRSRHRDMGLGAVVVLGAVAVAQGPAFLEGLHHRHWEDRRFFVQNQRNISTIGECFTRPSAWPGLYRPLTTNCYYFLGRNLWKNRIEVYHTINLSLFAANGLLLLWLCLDWLHLHGPGSRAPSSSRGSLITSSSPTRSSSRRSPLFFTLLALKLFLAGRKSDRRALEALSLPVFALALLSKESAVVWPAILGLHGWLFDRPSAARRYLPPVLVATASALLLALVIWPRLTEEPTGFAYDLSAAIVGRYAAYLLVFLNPLCSGLPQERKDISPAVLRLALSSRSGRLLRAGAGRGRGGLARASPPAGGACGAPGGLRPWVVPAGCPPPT